MTLDSGDRPVIADHQRLRLSFVGMLSSLSRCCFQQAARSKRDREAFSVVLGAVPETTALLDCRWDHIFFTGGTTVARIVMTAATKHLTPVVLELGGSRVPAIVHSSANVRVAARRNRSWAMGKRGTDLYRTRLRARLQGRG